MHWLGRQVRTVQDRPGPAAKSHAADRGSDVSVMTTVSSIGSAGHAAPFTGAGERFPAPAVTTGCRNGVCSGTWGRVRTWCRTMTRTATAVHVRPLPIPARGEARAIHWPVAWALSRHRTRCGTSPGRRRHICTSTQQRQRRPRPAGCDRRLSACPSGRPGVSAARSWAAHRNPSRSGRDWPSQALRTPGAGHVAAGGPSATAAGTSRMPPAAPGESPSAFARHCASSSRPRTPAARYLLLFPPVVGWTPMSTGPAQAASCSRCDGAAGHAGAVGRSLWEGGRWGCGRVRGGWCWCGRSDIGPGYFDTELTAALVADEEFSAWVRRRASSGRRGRSEDLIGAVISLVSPVFDFVCGHVLHVDDGMCRVR